MKIDKYLKSFNTLEINKTTVDVETDIKQLNFKNKLKYYGFYVVVVGLSSYMYIGIVNSIKSNEFNAKLIEQANISPISTLFYSDFSDEKQDTTKEIENNIKKLIDLKSKIKHKQRFIYTYDDFLDDVKSGKVNIDFDSALSTAREKYMKSYFIATLVQDSKSTVKLGSKDYSYLAISKKLSTLDQQTLDKAIMTPVNAILENMSIETTDDNVKALKEALRSLVYLRNRDLRFYKNLQIDKNVDSVLKNAVLAGTRYITLKSGYQVQKIKLLRFDKEYSQAKTKKKNEYNSKMKEIQVEIDNNKKAIKELKVTIKKEKELVQAIDRLQSDVLHYDDNKKIVKEILGELK